MRSLSCCRVRRVRRRGGFSVQSGLWSSIIASCPYAYMIPAQNKRGARFMVRMVGSWWYHVCGGVCSTVIDLSIVSAASGFNVWKNQSFGITPNKLRAPIRS